MNYSSSNSFRRALETRLLAQSTREGVSLVRLRKMVAFDRFLARLVVAQADRWLLKGGLALQLRLGDQARTTKDIDVSLRLPKHEVHEALLTAAMLDLDDWFEFTVGQGHDLLPGLPGNTWRFTVAARLDSRMFEHFHIDAGLGDPILEPAEMLMTPPLMAFAGIVPVAIPCYPLSQHLAEKIHAYARPQTRSENTRVKDLVDILLIASFTTLTAQALWAAIQATFAAQMSGVPPALLPDPPSAWSAKYRILAEDCELAAKSLAQGMVQARAFVNPVLSGVAQGRWHPEIGTWS